MAERADCSLNATYLSSSMSLAEGVRATGLCGEFHLISMLETRCQEAAEALSGLSGAYAHSAGSQREKTLYKRV